MSSTTKTLDRFRDKIAILRDRFSAGDSQCMDYDSHGFVTASAMSDASIAEFEREHRICLPDEYRSFLATFGDTTVGPSLDFRKLADAVTPHSSKPFPLTAPFLGGCSPDHLAIPKSEQWEDLKGLMSEWDAIPKGYGVLNIANYGCALYAVLVINGPNAGRVWMLSGDAAYYGPFGGSELLHDEFSMEWIPTDTPKEYSFFEWYEHWLDSIL